MRANLLLAFALVAGSAAYAEDAAGPPPAALTLAAARKAQYVATSDSRSADIYHVEAAPDGGIAWVEVLYDGRAIRLPGATLSATARTRTLKTSLSAKDLSKIN